MGKPLWNGNNNYSTLTSVETKLIKMKRANHKNSTTFMHKITSLALINRHFALQEKYLPLACMGVSRIMPGNSLSQSKHRIWNICSISNIMPFEIIKWSVSVLFINFAATKSKSKTDNPNSANDYIEYQIEIEIFY